MAAALTLIGASQGIEAELITKAGGAAAAFSLLGMLVVLPLFVSQRREIQRLTRWRELEPHRGESGDDPISAPAPVSATRPGELSPLERVTGERPALERITAERAALESPSFWRRLIARGPRHPLILSAVAILLAVIAVVIVSLSGRLSDQQGPGGEARFDRTSVDLVVLNGSSTNSLAGKVADSLTAAGFEQVRTGVTGTSKQTVVLYDKGNRRAGRVLKRELGAKLLEPLDRATRAAAPGADVVVVAGEDRAKA